MNEIPFTCPHCSHRTKLVEVEGIWQTRCDRCGEHWILKPEEEHITRCPNPSCDNTNVFEITREGVSLHLLVAIEESGEHKELKRYITTPGTITTVKCISCLREGIPEEFNFIVS